MLEILLLRLRRPLVLALYLALVPAAFGLAFGLRFDFHLPPDQVAVFWRTLPFLAAARLLALVAFGQDRSSWRHVGVHDLVALTRATAMGSLAFLLLVFATGTMTGLSRSVLVLECALSLLLVGGMRFGVRVVREVRPELPWRRQRGPRTLLVGAGQAAERLLRECLRDGLADMHPVGLVDDDPGKVGLHLHGVPVVGTTAALAAAVDRTRAELIVISIPSAPREDMRRLVEACIAVGRPFKITPSLRELLDGRVRASQVRDVQIEDLLSREAVDIPLDDLRVEMAGRVVLVTGGAGSIGSELARQVARLGPGRLVVLDQAESPLYFVHRELELAHPGLTVVPVVADVTDERRIESVFEQHRPDYVFHAAAYKHVPLIERNPVEAVRTNVFGTLTVAQSAARHRASRFVLISTDKAVAPTSAMGASKRLAERIVLGWPVLRQSATDFRAVRFGNVLGSDGSVIPVFKKQLAEGEALTVTHPDVTRYFMTITEAVQLVLRAAALPDAAGRISMLEMGDPVRIVDLAENLIRLSGLEPYRDVPIVFTGLREGEKMSERLVDDGEEQVETAVRKVYVVRTPELDPAVLAAGLDRLAATAAVAPASEIRAVLNEVAELGAAPARAASASAAGREPRPT